MCEINLDLSKCIMIYELLRIRALRWSFGKFQYQENAETDVLHHTTIGGHGSLTAPQNFMSQGQKR